MVTEGLQGSVLGPVLVGMEASLWNLQSFFVESLFHRLKSDPFDRDFVFSEPPTLLRQRTGRPRRQCLRGLFCAAGRRIVLALAGIALGPVKLGRRGIDALGWKQTRGMRMLRPISTSTGCGPAMWAASGFTASWAGSWSVTRRAQKSHGWKTHRLEREGPAIRGPRTQNRLRRSAHDHPRTAAPSTSPAPSRA